MTDGEALNIAVKALRADPFSRVCHRAVADIQAVMPGTEFTAEQIYRRSIMFACEQTLKLKYGYGPTARRLCRDGFEHGIWGRVPIVLRDGNDPPTMHGITGHWVDEDGNRLKGWFGVHRVPAGAKYVKSTRRIEVGAEWLIRALWTEHRHKCQDDSKPKPVYEHGKEETEYEKGVSRHGHSGGDDPRV